MQILPEDSNANFQASAFFVLEAAAACPHCGVKSRVFALALPAGHHWLQMDEDDESCDAWRAAMSPAVLSHVQSLNGVAALRLRDLAPGYRPGSGAPDAGSGWINHCDRCGLALQDDDLHCEPGAAFLPLSSQAARVIRLMEVQEAVEIHAAGCAPEADWLAHVTRV